MNTFFKGRAFVVCGRENYENQREKYEAYVVGLQIYAKLFRVIYLLGCMTSTAAYFYFRIISTMKFTSLTHKCFLLGLLVQAVSYNYLSPFADTHLFSLFI